VFLDRGKSAGLERMGVDSALQQLMQYSRAYGAATQARHKRVLRRLLRTPAYKLRYESLRNGIEALEGLTD